jgi:SAM-dependent methyltransferase
VNDRTVRARVTFEERWSRGDPWDVAASHLDQASYARQIDLLSARRYERALEIGCGAGVFTRLLAPLTDRLLALDVAPSAIERARAGGIPAGVEFRAQDAMDLDPAAQGTWDLAVMSETVYCLGWLYPLFDLAWFAARLFDATCSRGRFLMANTYGRPTDHLMSPWLIDTYRDLFRHVGYRVEHEEVLRGTKNGIEFSVLITLFEKRARGSA